MHACFQRYVEVSKGAGGHDVTLRLDWRGQFVPLEGVKRSKPTQARMPVPHTLTVTESRSLKAGWKWKPAARWSGRGRATATRFDCWWSSIAAPFSVLHFA